MSKAKPASFETRVKNAILSGEKFAVLMHGLAVEALRHHADHACGSKLVHLLNAATKSKVARPDALRVWIGAFCPIAIRFDKETASYKWSTLKDKASKAQELLVSARERAATQGLDFSGDGLDTVVELASIAAHFSYLDKSEKEVAQALITAAKVDTQLKALVTRIDTAIEKSANQAEIYELKMRKARIAEVLRISDKANTEVAAAAA